MAKSNLLKTAFGIAAILVVIFSGLFLKPAKETKADNVIVKNDTKSVEHSTVVEENNAEKSESENTLALNTNSYKPKRYISRNKSGFIGYFDDKPLDNPIDNVFHVQIDRKLQGNETIWLDYELYGVEDYTGIAHSINDQLSVGGYIVKKSNQWKKQREQLNPSDIKKGDNVIRFTLPEGADYGFQVRNLSIYVEPYTEMPINNPKPERRLIVNQPTTEYYYGKLGYLQGYVIGDKNDKAEILIDGEKIRYNQGTFESLVEKNTDDENWMVTVQAIFDDGQLLSVEVPFNKPAEWDTKNGFDKNIHYSEQLATKQNGFDIQLANAHLIGEEGTVEKETKVSITALRDRDIPALDAGMVNVTAGYAGYRFLPHGTQFQKDVAVELGYDTTKIPNGYGENDIQTYFFDEVSHHWISIPRDSVLLAANITQSRTNHFSDYINAIIKVPESPETQGYTPTSMKDVKAANPATGVNLIQPPQANSMGNANLSYPINIPAGRQGMQPQLAISYNSGGGNGWLGLGWDLSVPSISIETRWGVPRYDPVKESETYTMGGEQLSPVAHRSEWVDRDTKADAEKQFYPRVEGSFSKIIRHGNSPKNYWWEVTDKNGIRYFYGAASDGNLLNSAILKDAAGNIAHWALVEVRDLNENFVKYEYTIQADKGLLDPSAADGYQIYLDNVSYTGHGTENGKYKVKFSRDRELSNFTKRKDVTISAIYGFKQVTADLLKSIEVEFNNTPVRSYELTYTEGAFNKTLLETIIEKDSKGDVFNEHVFEYYDDVRKNGIYQPFQEVNKYTVPYDKVRGDDAMSWASTNAAGGSKSRAWGLGTYVGVGWDYVILKKNLSAGFNYDYDQSKNDGLLALVDIDGDGLADRVFIEDGTFKYRRMLPGDPNIFAEETTIGGNINSFQYTQSKTNKFELGVYPGPPYIGGSSSITTTKTSTYFTDANSDGLIDIVKEGKVYFNRLIDGKPHFNQSSDGTPNPIVKGNDLSSLLNFNSLNDDEVAKLKQKNPLQDAVKMWIAPLNGRIKIDAPLKLIQNPESESNFLDGIIVSIQKNNSIIWNTTITKDNFNKVFPTGVDDIAINKDDRIYFRIHSIDNGFDDIVLWNPEITYLDEDLSLLDPNNKPYYYYNAKDDFLLSNNFELSPPLDGIVNIESVFKKPHLSDDINVFITKYNKELNITETLWHSSYPWDSDSIQTINLNNVDVAVGDKISFTVYSNTNVDWNKIEWKPYLYYIESKDPEIPTVVSDSGDHFISTYPVVYYTVYPELYKMGQVYEIPVFTDELTVHTFLTDSAATQVGTYEMIALELGGDTLAKGKFEVDSGFFASDSVLKFPCESGTEMMFEFINFDSLTRDAVSDTVFIESDNELFNSVYHPVTDTFEYNPKTSITVFGGIDTTGSYLDPEELTGSIFLSVKQRDTLLAKKELKYRKGMALVSEALEFEAYSGDSVYFEYHVNSDSRVLVKYIKDNVRVQIKNSSYYTNAFVNSMLLKDELYQLGNLYRGWGQFGYNGNDGRGADPIIESRLDIRADLDTQDKEESDDYKIDNLEGEDMNELEGDFEGKGGYNASKAIFVLMRPDVESKRWVGYDNSVFVTVDTVSCSRMGEKEITAESDVPSGGSGFVAPVKKNKDVTWAASANIFGLGTAGSTGNSQMLTDYMDMNGDRYPDIIAGGVVQYTNQTGGLSDNTLQIGNVNSSTSSTSGLTVGGGIMKKVVNAVSKRHNLNLIGNMTSVGVSKNNSTNEDEHTYSDINGDGLPDKLYKNGEVALNYGYSFGAPEKWQYKNGIQKTVVKSKKGSVGYGKFGLDINLETGEINGGSVQFSFKDGSYVAGAGLYSSKSSPNIIMMDVNSDGMPDQLSWNGDEEVTVKLNRGNGFDETAIPWPGIDKICEDVSLNGAFNTAGTFGFTLSVIPVKFVFNPRFNLSRTVSRAERKLMDFTGDGKLDYVVSHDITKLKLQRSTIRRTNLLKRVNRPLGAAFVLDYKPVGNTYEMPQAVWALSKVEVFDGYIGDGIDKMSTTFDYEDGYHDRHERAFYGFGEVKTTQHDEDSNTYRTTIRTFANSNYYEKGLLLSETIQDAGENKYVETTNTYVLKNRDMDNLPADLDTWTTDVAFPALVETEKKFYEGNSEAQKSTITNFGYGAYGNVTSYTEFGAPGDDSDDISATIDYWEVSNKNILSVPKSIIVSGNGETLRRRGTTIDNNTGKITQIRQYLEQGQPASYEMEYDEYGNLVSIRRPENYKGERMHFAYEYDDVVHNYVTKVSDAYGYSSSTTYDYKFGQVLSTTDINGQQTIYEIDELGRIKKITGPYEIASGQDYTIRFNYYPNDEVAWAHTQHYDPEHPGNPIETAIFIDGLGRVLQTKKDGALFKSKNAEDDEERIVSGRVEFDAFGRSVASYYPVTDHGHISKIEETINDIAPTTVEYDILDRTVKTILPDGAETTTEYGFGNDRNEILQFMTSVTDANGITTESFTDVKGRQTAVKAPGETWTSFVYNAINELVEVTDAEDNVTTSEYDMLGRRLSRNHPDAGITEYSYDLSGNMTNQITANLRDSGYVDGIVYEYDYNRLISITYPENTVNNVLFEYGQPGAKHNRAGRIVVQEDGTGVQEFFYGPLGEITKNIRSVIVPDQGVFTFETEWEYDTWNRLKKMVYPDGEVVTYNYNKGGLLHDMYGKKKGTRYNYISQIGYDKFEDRSYMGFGNGTETYYEYEPDRRRLHHIAATTSVGRKLMDNTYTYDSVNNITNLKSNAPIPGIGFRGGKFDYNYEYDDLYRLVGANGHFEGAESEHKYELDMSYSPTGCILNKDQVHQSRDRGETAWETRGKTTYDWDYKYEGTKPHAPSQIGPNAYTYDANGNQTGWQRVIDGGGKTQRRDILWDEENRIRAIAENGSTHHYMYDASGERVIKATGDGQAVYINGFPMGGSGTVGSYTMYVNPYMVVCNMNFTKHFYIEGQRIVSKLGEGGAYQYLLDEKNTIYVAGGDTINFDKKLLQQKEQIIANFEDLGLDGVVFTAGKSGKTPYGQIKKYYRQQNGDGVTHVKDTNKATANANEKFRYFYHTDHLGSSSYITDASGEVYQHFEYFPFGETFYEARADHHRTPYMFNGKELDKETGLYYYGARYYDPRISMFYGVDAYAEKYSDLSPYQYGGNNPMLNIDINGDSTYVVVYGAGYLNYQHQGGSHDVGGGFKKNAEAYAGSIKNRPGYDAKRDQVVLVEGKSTKQITDATNKKYSTGKIAELVVFSHGYEEGVSLGGQSPNDPGVSLADANAQLGDYDKREINANNMSQIDINNFEDKARVSFFGCNIGGYYNSSASNSFGQTFVNYMGGNRTVKAFTGGAEFTTTSGRVTYTGRMIRSRDRNSQLTKFTVFKKNQTPRLP